MTVSTTDRFDVRHRYLSDDRVWLATVLGVSCLIYLVYLVTHPYPAYGAGLYSEIAEQITRHGYTLPKSIPGYTSNGVPFAYPPLMFYVAAAVRDVTGVDAITYSRVVPGLFVMASLVPYYYTAKELLPTVPHAGVATLVFAVTPEALQWHLSAGGMVRAPALLFTLTGAFMGVRLFRDDEYRWLVPSALLFGLTVLTHPTYTVFFVLTFVLLFATFDRTPSGLATGAAVALGGFLLASPWWLEVVSIHGVDTFFGAAGTHSGLGGGVERVVRVFVYPLEPDADVLFYLGVFVGTLYGVVRRRTFLLGWFFVPGFVVGKPRFLFVAGSLLSASFLLDWVLPRVRRHTASGRTLAPTAVAVVLVVLATGTGTLFAASLLDSHGESATQPAFVDDDDVEAMRWVETTPTDAEFVVAGDAAEWFPHLTDRTILVGPWGVEWTTPAQYSHQLTLYKELSVCHTERCLTTTISNADVSPDYVYVPKDEYTVRGFEHAQPSSMRTGLIESDRYDLVYENDGVMIFRTVTVPDAVGGITLRTPTDEPGPSAVTVAERTPEGWPSPDAVVATERAIGEGI